MSEIATLREMLKKVVDPDVVRSVATARQSQMSYGCSVPLPAGCQRESVRFNGVPSLRIVPENCSAKRAILLFHSGGYSSGSAADHAAMLATLAMSAEAIGYAVDYRLAPEQPFPAALEDAVESYLGLIETGMDPTGVALVGDSAGGGLALALAQEIAKRGLPRVGCLYLISPWVDLTLSGRSYELRKRADPVLSREILRHLASVYLGSQDPSDPRASPLFGSHLGMPPILIHVGGDEVLLSDALAVAERAAIAGGEVSLKVWAEMIHIFPWYFAQLSAGREALAQAGAWISKRIMAQERQAMPTTSIERGGK
jgi:monoterpene epsilon-lactone hydrolase